MKKHVLLVLKETLSLINLKLTTTKDKIGLISASLIGPSINEREIKTIMDIDLVIVIENPMTSEKYELIQNIFNELMSLEENDIALSYKIADGPIKPLYRKSYNLFFHVLLHTNHTYVDSPLYLCKNSWQFESKTLIGLPLIEIQYIKTISWDLVLNSKLGINHCLDMINEKCTNYLVWLPTKDETMEISLIPYKLDTNREILELATYSVLRAACNSLKVIMNNAPNIGLSKNDIGKFSKIFFDFEDKGTPLYFLKIKENIRSDNNYYDENKADQLIKNACEFLDSYRKYLQIKYIT